MSDEVGAAEPSWLLPEPFTIDVVVRPEDVDRYGHTNNAVYLTWCERCTWAHSEAEGMDFAGFEALNRAMVIRRSQMEYLAPSFEGDRLRVANWIVMNDRRLTATRRFQICRLSDGQTLLQGDIFYVCIDLESGRPRRMPAEFLERYEVLDAVRERLEVAGERTDRRARERR